MDGSTDVVSADFARVWSSRPNNYYGLQLEFHERSHRYTLGGDHVPSVTTILNRLSKPALVPWATKTAVEYIRSRGVFRGNDYVVPAYVFDNAKQAPNAVRDAAGDFGTAFHKYAQRRLEKPTDGYPRCVEDIAHAVSGFEEWLGQNDVVPIALERLVVSNEHWYAGTVDFVGFVNGRLTVMDYKTSSGIYPTYWLQLAAYAAALIEEAKSKIDDDVASSINGHSFQYICLHVDRETGRCTPHTRKYAPAWNEVFSHLCEVDLLWPHVAARS